MHDRLPSPHLRPPTPPRCSLAWRAALAAACLSVSTPTAMAYDYGLVASGTPRTSYPAEDCPGGERRVANNDETVSEGIGYGMLIEAYAGSQANFDGLWSYYKARRNTRGFMNWRIAGCTTDVQGANGATDGDLDVAFALLVAETKWPSGGYGAEAGRLIDVIQRYEFTECNGEIVQKPGDSFGGCTCTNPSYFAPAYYRVFGDFIPSQKAFWDKAAADTYALLARNKHASSGLYMAWTNADGTAVTEAECNVAADGGGTLSDYQYDAARVPYRIALDYLWHGSPDAQGALATMVQWLGSQSSFGDRYSHSGQMTRNFRNSVHIGGFTMAALTGTDQSLVDRLRDTWVQQHMGGDDQYYQATLGTLYDLAATGAMARPNIAACAPSCAGRACGSDGCGGTCGECAGAEACDEVAGTCACEAPAEMCSGVCVDTRNDPQNCGECGNDCGPGLSCTGTVCINPCRLTELDCGSGCQDVASDPSNCGGCGMACNAGEACVNRVCQPGGGLPTGTPATPPTMTPAIGNLATDGIDTNSDGINDALDTNSDGVPDAFDLDGTGAVESFDLDGNGRTDAWDTDENGVIDAWDRDLDGFAELFDETGDGKPDAWDTDGDGRADLFDRDGDGEFHPSSGCAHLPGGSRAGAWGIAGALLLLAAALRRRRSRGVTRRGPTA